MDVVRGILAGVLVVEQIALHTGDAGFAAGADDAGIGIFLIEGIQRGGRGGGAAGADEGLGRHHQGIIGVELDIAGDLDGGIRRALGGGGQDGAGEIPAADIRGAGREGLRNGGRHGDAHHVGDGGGLLRFQVEAIEANGAVIRIEGHEVTRLVWRRALGLPDEAE